MAPRKTDRTDADGLTDRQRVFVAEYLANGLNATKAALAAGYSKQSARQAGSENLSKPAIKAAIAAKLQPRLEELELTAERLDQELAYLAYFDPASLYDKDGHLLSIPDMAPAARRALAGFEVETRFDWVDDPLSPGRKRMREHAGYTRKVRHPAKVEALTLAYRRLKLLGEADGARTGAGALNVSININGRNVTAQATTAKDGEA